MALRSRRFWIGSLALACASVAVWLVADAKITRRTIAPEERRRGALQAIDAARRGPASRWAPQTLAAAETSLQQALLEWSRQEARWGIRRDFRPAAAALWRAEQAAREATRSGAERREEAKRSAVEAMNHARGLRSQAESLAAATSLSAEARYHLQRARLLLDESEGLLLEGEMIAARAGAERSLTELGRVLGPALAAAERYVSRAELLRWQRWADETRDWSRRTRRTAILVFKEKNLLTLLRSGIPSRTYRVEIGANALGTKAQRGDRATPEGRYRIVAKKDRGRSLFHRALLLDYPNADDRRRFSSELRSGQIPEGAGIGGSIEIHGEGGRGRNWTDGCVALVNRDMDELFSQVEVGTRVTIVGGDGRDGAFTDLLPGLVDGRGEGKP